MPIPVNILSALMADPIAFAVIRVPAVMKFLNAHPEYCQLLLDEPINGGFTVAMLADEYHAELAAAAAAAAAPLAAALPVVAPLAAAPPAAAPPAPPGPLIDPTQAVFNRSAISIIRDAIREMLPSRAPNTAPVWGGRLLLLLVNPRNVFGYGQITDGAAAIIGEMVKDLPDLVREIVANNGTWPAPTSPAHLQMCHHLARYWARRLMRNILVGLVQNHRIELAAARNEPRPAPYRADDLDKELRNAGDVNGTYLVEENKRPRQ